MRFCYWLRDVRLIPELRLNPEFEGRMDQATNVVAENLAEDLIRHARVSLRPDMIAKLRLDHAECRFDYANRWMVLRVAEATLIRLVSRIIPLSEVIPDASRDDFIYFLDISADNSTKAYLSLPSSVPEEYKPVSGRFLEPQEEGKDSHSYAFLLQGEWSADAIGDFPKAFNKIYSILYGMNVLHTGGYVTHPWRGDFSSMHFFNEAMSNVPRKDRPYVDSMQKSSPGFIRFTLQTQTAEQAVDCINDFKAKEWAIVEDAKTLRRFIRDHGLNDNKTPESPIWEEVNKRLSTLARQLVSYFSVINEDQFIKMCPRPFEAAKIALSFVKYVSDLFIFEKQGLVEFPGRLGGSSD